MRLNSWSMMRRGRAILAGMALALFCLNFPDRCGGEGPPRIVLGSTASQKLSLTVGKSILVESPRPAKRVSLASPEIADALVLTPRQIYLTGKAPGITNLTLWGVEEKVSVILDLEVSPDISRLKERFHQILPEEKEIQVMATHDSLTLSGSVSSTSALSQALALAEPYFPKKVVNLLEVAGVHQVMLEVRVSEISRSLLKRLGVNFNFISSSGRQFGVTLLNSLTKIGGSFPAQPLSVSDKVNAIFRFLSRGATWTVFIDALKEEGLLKVLAEPTLITLSGKSANFLAGGEFPVPVPQSGGAGGGITITIAYKPFGVGLNFTPTVLSNKKISMQVAPEVSELDFANAISISGFTIPALTTRRVSTVIELADGQSFAVAGLLKDQIRETVDKYPLLGDLPVLGALFRSTSFRKDETELVIIVTCHLVKPLDMTKQTLPTDQYIEPDDYELYLGGKLEGQGKKESSGPAPSPMPPDKKGGLEGDFGHIIPK